MYSIRSNLFGLFVTVIILSEFVCNQTNNAITIFHKYYSTTFSKSKHFPHSKFLRGCRFLGNRKVDIINTGND